MSRTHTGRRTLPGNVWARMLRVSLLLGACVAALLLGIAWLVDGSAAAASVAVGAAVVVFVFAVSLVALWWASRYPPALAAMVMLILYVGLVFAGAIILFAAPAPQGLEAPWVGAATVGQLCAWLTGVAYAARRTRLPIFDVQTTARPSKSASPAMKDQMS